MLEFMNKDGMLDAFYASGLADGPNNRWLGKVAGQIAMRNPGVNILEIGMFSFAGDWVRWAA